MQDPAHDADDPTTDAPPTPTAPQARRRIKLTGPVTLIIVGGSGYLLLFGGLVALSIFTGSSARYEITLVLVSVTAISVIAGLCWLLDRRTAARQMVGRRLAEAMHERRDRAEERVEETQIAMAGELVTIHAMNTAIYNATGSLPEIKRLLMANQAASIELNRTVDRAMANTAEGIAALREEGKRELAAVKEEILDALAKGMVENLVARSNGKVSVMHPRS